MKEALAYTLKSEVFGNEIHKKFLMPRKINSSLLPYLEMALGISKDYPDFKFTYIGTYEKYVSLEGFRKLTKQEIKKYKEENRAHEKELEAHFLKTNITSLEALGYKVTK